MEESKKTSYPQVFKEFLMYIIKIIEEMTSNKLKLKYLPDENFIISENEVQRKLPENHIHRLK